MIVSLYSSCVIHLVVTKTEQFLKVAARQAVFPIPQAACEQAMRRRWRREEEGVVEGGKREVSCGRIG